MRDLIILALIFNYCIVNAQEVDFKNIHPVSNIGELELLEQETPLLKDENILKLYNYIVLETSFNYFNSEKNGSQLNTIERLLKIHPNEFAKAHFWKFKADYLYDLGDKITSSKYYIKALKVFEKYDDKRAIIACLGLYALTNYSTNNGDKSTIQISSKIHFSTIYKRLLKLKRTKLNIHEEFILRTNLINNFIYTLKPKNKEEELIANNIALKALVDTNKELAYGKSYIYFNAADLAFDKKNYEEAIEYYNKSLNLYEKNDYNSRSIIYTNIAEATYLLKNKKEYKKLALLYIEKACALNAKSKLQSKGETASLLTSYKDILVLNKKYEEALVISDSIYKLTNQVFEENRDQKINEIQTVYQTEKKNKKLNYLKGIMILKP